MSALAVAAALAAQSVPGSAAAADFDVTHYQVQLTINYGEQAIAGRTRIDLRVGAADLEVLRFSPNALSVTSATLNGRPVRFERRDDGLAFVPRQPLRRGSRWRLEVAYAGAQVQGLTFAGASVHSGWPSCSWMICRLDTPGDKASLDLSLTVAGGHKTVGPGILLSQTRGPKGVETHRWRSAKPYSSYLYAFAAGPFEEWRTRAGQTELRVASRTAGPQQLERLFAPTASMLRFFEQRAGVRFPWPSYTQLHVAGSAAQEAVSSASIGEREISPILANPQDDWVIAHELAHQWWGNLVTCEDWTHFWLNEGLVTFMTAAWKEERWGRPAYERELQIARRRVQAAKDAGIDVPLTFAGAYPSLQLRRAITYSKGSLFLDALRREIGDAAFWRALKAFTVRHAGATANSRDFQQAAEQASGRNLSALFDAWVY